MLLDWFRPRPVRTARIVTSGCRGYLLQLESAGSITLVTDRSGRPKRFATLDAARAAARRRGVRQARLLQHHACEEACAGGVATPIDPGVSVLH